MEADQGHRTIQTESLKSGTILIENVECDDCEQPLARSGEIVDTKIIEALKSKGVTRVRIKAVVPNKPGTDAHLKARKQVEDIVREALTEIAPRFRHVNLKELHIKTLLHACALRRARQLIIEKKKSA